MLIMLQGRACNKPSQSFHCQEKAPFVYLGAFSVIVKSSRSEGLLLALLHGFCNERDGAIAFISSSSSTAHRGISDQQFFCPEKPSSAMNWIYDVNEVEKGKSSAWYISNLEAIIIDIIAASIESVSNFGTYPGDP